MRVTPALNVARRAAHLGSRFVGSLRPRGLRAADVAFVESALTPAELRVWEALGPADRAESVAVARRLVACLRSTPHAGEDRWVAAALLHDVGKAPCGLGPVGRAGATLAGAAPFVRPRGRFAQFLRHADLGAAALRAAGARPEAVAWAAAHHDPERWPEDAIPPEVCEALARADGEVVRRTPR